jgi:hypothetical protein
METFWETRSHRVSVVGTRCPDARAAVYSQRPRMAQTPFPWPTPDPGDLRMRGGESDVFTARKVVEWFVDNWAPGFKIPGTAPLGLLLDTIAYSERGEMFTPFASLEEQVAWEYRLFALRRLEWSIRALHGRAGRLLGVHQSFITKELMGVDSRTATWGMPLGVGTVCVAGRLMQAAGGEMTITGTGAAGHDIRWEPATGGLVILERKDRAFEIGATESIASRVKYLIGKVREAGRGFPRDPDAGRVLAVGFPGYVPANAAKRTRRRIDVELRRAFGASPRSDELPDFLIVESVGSQPPATGSYHVNVFFNVIDFGFDRPAWRRVSDVFSRAYTVKGSRKPGPWPIRL